MIIRNKLSTKLSTKQKLISIIDEITSIITAIDHSEYNPLMHDHDMKELLRLSKRAKKLIKDLQ
jgi:hypothetical protein